MVNKASTDGSKIFIAIAGNIGTGKTSLTQMLSRRFGWTPHFESVTDNPYLVDFYKDMTRWSFPLQIFFLNHRFSAHQAVTQGSNSAIQDRSIYEDANIFARNLYEQGQMEERDYKNYLQLYTTMTSFLQPPDLVLYLRKSLPKLKEQIAKRGRDFEQSIPDAYLENLNRYYDDWMEGYEGKKLIVTSDTLDFVENPQDFDYIATQIVAALDQRDLFWESRAKPGLATARPSEAPGTQQSFTSPSLGF
ncbi:MAG TPA: deoxynucleoside kinase [Bdellovibrionota bacterium]|nr:deoxynucleoside kinase [Bdellovibrionota bacterium]